MGPPVKRSFYLTYCSGILLCSSRGAPGGPGWTRGQLELHDQAHAFGDALALGEIDGVVALDVGAIAGVGRLDPAGRGDLGPSGDRTNLREPRRRPLCGRDRPPQSREALAIVGAVARRHVRLEPQRRRGANVRCDLAGPLWARASAGVPPVMQDQAPPKFRCACLVVKDPPFGR